MVVSAMHLRIYSIHLQSYLITFSETNTGYVFSNSYYVVLLLVEFLLFELCFMLHAKYNTAWHSFHGHFERHHRPSDVISVAM